MLPQADLRADHEEKCTLPEQSDAAEHMGISTDRNGPRKQARRNHLTELQVHLK